MNAPRKLLAGLRSVGSTGWGWPREWHVSLFSFAATWRHKQNRNIVLILARRQLTGNNLDYIFKASAALIFFSRAIVLFEF